MANGDAAAAAGMDVVVGTADLRLAYDEENKGRDYLANHMNAGTAHTIAQVGGLAAAIAAINSSLAGKQDTIGFPLVERIGATHVKLGFDGGATTIVFDVGGLTAYLRRTDDGQFGSTPIYTPHGRANPVVTSYVSAYINSDGRIGATPSSARFKQDIQTWSPDQQAILALQLVTFRYKAAVDELGEDAQVEVGLIAEDLHTLGLTWLVVYDEHQAPFSVHYERLALALLPVIQSHEQRLTALEQKVSN